MRLCWRLPSDSLDAFVTRLGVQLGLTQSLHRFLLLFELVLVLVHSRLVLNDGVACRAHLVNLAAEVVVRERGQLLTPVRVLVQPSQTRHLLAMLVPRDETLHVQVPVRGALNRVLVLLDVLHLSADRLAVDVGRHGLTLQALHDLSVFLVDALRLSLLVKKVKRPLLLERPRAVDHGARAHVRHQLRLV